MLRGRERIQPVTGEGLDTLDELVGFCLYADGTGKNQTIVVCGGSSAG